MSVVVVTGATRGIGREVVRQLLARGDDPVLTGRDPAAVERQVHELASVTGRQPLGLVVDVTDARSVTAAAADLDRRVGTIDGLVNNAAIHYDTWQRATTADLATVEEAMATNVLGAWRVTLAMLPLLRRSRRPRLVNVSSEGGSISEMSGGTPAYAVSKAALNALTRLLAGELARDRVLVNAVCPGWIATDMGGAGGAPVELGARRVIWGLDLPDDGPSGGFFRDGHALPW
jgi:NAD(P)-dependent dehydrogenase (short-subunit alcohol dehydrogenase family)